MNLAIISANLVDGGSLSATSEASGFPVTNLKLEQKSLTWRSIGTSATITATMPSAIINGVALAFTNLTSSATIEIQLYLSGASQLTTGALPMGFTYDPPHGFATNSGVSFAFGGGNYFSSFFADKTADEVRVIINDASNPDGRLEISRLIIGNGFTPKYNADYDALLTPLDKTQGKRKESGDAVINRGTISKQLSFDLSAMPAEDKQEVNKIARRNGKSSPVFISLMPNVGGEDEQSYQIYGYVTDDIPAVVRGFNLFSSSVQVEEI